MKHQKTITKKTKQSAPTRGDTSSRRGTWMKHRKKEKKRLWIGEDVYANQKKKDKTKKEIFEF
jgi:hypothetical protein